MPGVEQLEGCTVAVVREGVKRNSFHTIIDVVPTLRVTWRRSPYSPPPPNSL
jgi:hypothetical protein